MNKINDLISSKLAAQPKADVASDVVRYTIQMKESERASLNAAAKRVNMGAIELASQIFSVALAQALDTIAAADKAITK